MMSFTKRSIAVAVMAAALMPMATAEAQNTNTTQIKEEEWRDGDYIVHRYTTTNTKPQSNAYEIHFEINSSDVTTGYDHNDNALASLDSFFAECRNMPSRHIKGIAVTGYASPDGSTTFNTELAHERAKELGMMLIERYGLQESSVTLSSHVEPWSATADGIEHSTLANREELTSMVEGKATPMVIDNNLKHDKTAWAYIKSDVLPPLRRATIVVTFTEDKTEIVREYSPLPQQPTEIIIIEELTEEKPRHHKHHNHHHNMVTVYEWDGIIIDAGASTEGNRPQ